MVRLTVATDLLVDRHYRGAIVMTGAKMFAVAEEAAQLIEQVQNGEWATKSPNARAILAKVADDLVVHGVLRVEEES